MLENKGCWKRRIWSSTCFYDGEHMRPLLLVACDDWLFVCEQWKTARLDLVQGELAMKFRKNGQLSTSNTGEGGLLYVTDIVSDSQEVLQFACELAERHGGQLEVLHVIDLEQTSSHPEAQMGIQYSLEALARSLKNLKRNTCARLLFGHPKEVIARRAAEMKADLIAIHASDASSQRVEKELVKRLSKTCSCPVLILSTLSVMKMRENSNWELACR